MAFEDVDYCLRAWDAGLRVVYAPAAALTHHESKTRGTVQGAARAALPGALLGALGRLARRPRRRAGPTAVRGSSTSRRTPAWAAATGSSSRTSTASPSAATTSSCGRSRDGPPDWFDLHVPVRTFPDYPALAAALAPLRRDQGRDLVADGGLGLGGVACAAASPVYWVQDIETSLLRRRPGRRTREVLASYRPEFAYFAGSQWIADRLARARAARGPASFTPGLDVERFRSLRGRRASRTT